MGNIRRRRRNFELSANSGCLSSRILSTPSGQNLCSLLTPCSTCQNQRKTRTRESWELQKYRSTGRRKKERDLPEDNLVDLIRFHLLQLSFCVHPVLTWAQAMKDHDLVQKRSTRRILEDTMLPSNAMKKRECQKGRWERILCNTFNRNGEKRNRKTN